MRRGTGPQRAPGTTRLVALLRRPGVLLEPGLRFDGDVVRQVAERDIRVDQVQAPGLVRDGMESRRAVDRADLEYVRIVARVAGARVALTLDPGGVDPAGRGDPDQGRAGAEGGSRRERRTREDGSEKRRTAAERR